MDADRVVAQLAQDREHGASEIALEASRALAQLAREAEDSGSAILEAGTRLIHAHPAVAPLLHVVDRAVARLDQEGFGGLDRLADEAEARREAVVAAAQARVPQDARIVTYSRSGTVLAALARAAQPGGLSVHVSEGRPGGEGIGVARALAEAGAAVTLTTDAALPSALAEADRVLVGADTLCLHGVVNKVGTGMLALAAREAGVPITVLATSDKLLPATYMEAPPLEATGEPGWDVPPSVRVHAPLFELAPWERFTEVLTEQGACSPDELVQGCKRLELHPRLVDALG